MPVFSKRELGIETLAAEYYTDPEDPYFGLPRGEDADLVRAKCKGYGQLALAAQNAAVDAREHLLTLVRLAAPNFHEYVARALGGPQRLDDLTTGEILAVALPLMQARDAAIEKVLLWESYGHGVHLHEKVQAIAAGLDYERQLQDEIATLRQRLAAHPTTEDFSTRLARVTQVIAERDAAQQARDVAQAQLKSLQHQLVALQTELANTRATPTATANLAPAPAAAQPTEFAVQNATAIPQRIVEFQADPAYARNRVIVQLLGETGVPLQPDVIRLFQAHTGQSDATARRSITACAEYGLLAQHAAKRPGGHIYLLQLTSLGEQCYEHLYGRPSVPQTLARLLKRHATPQHVYLILETQRVLTAAGFAVELYPEVVRLTEYGDYHPDLVARYGDQVLYIEAENTQAPKNNREQRRAKWRRAVVAGQGTLYLTVWRAPEGRALGSKIVGYVGDMGMPLAIYMLTLDSYATGSAPVPGMGVWTLERTVH